MGNNIGYCRDGPQTGCKCNSCKQEIATGVPRGLVPSKKREMYVKRTYWDNRNKARVEEVKKEYPNYVPVYINVYDHCHVAVEVYDREISFNTHGRIYNQPGKFDYGKVYWYQVLVGFTTLTWEQVLQAIDMFQKGDFKEGTYFLLGKNCRKFSKKFSEYLCSFGDKQEKGFKFKSKDHFIIGVK